MTRLQQQTPGCSDFDVLLGDEMTPSFRVLLPEWIRGEGLAHNGLLHVISGAWQGRDTGWVGSFTVGDQLLIEVRIDLMEKGILVELGVTNTGTVEIVDLWANVCSAVNHLPGNPAWCNQHFLPVTVPLERGEQGRFWFETLAPKRLFALTSSGWSPMHPCPDDPESSSLPAYNFVPSATTDAAACVIESFRGGYWFYQSWNTPCRWCTPCSGNACMHLEPFLAEKLSPASRAGIRGWIGMHRGDRTSLGQVIRSMKL